MEIKDYLQDNGITQAGFAEQLGVTQGLVNQWIRGKTRVTPERALQIERATAGGLRRERLRPDIFCAERH